jgi:hypothetical protein
VSADADLARLDAIADELEHGKERRDRLFDERKKIWRRLLKSGNVTKTAIAQASRCGVANIDMGLGRERWKAKA